MNMNMQYMCCQMIRNNVQTEQNIIHFVLSNDFKQNTLNLIYVSSSEEKKTID